MLPTGCRPLDLLLGGGLPPKIITQVYGPASSGKTNICLQTLYQAARAGKRTAFIDTEGSFIRKRVEQVCGQYLKRVLENTFLIECHEFDQQRCAIEKAVSLPADIIIVDSMTSLYRLEMTEDKIQATNKQLSRQLAVLTQYAREKNAPVLVTNQVYTDIDTGEVMPVGGDMLRYACKVIIGLEKWAKGVRCAVLRKHAFRREGQTALFQIVGRGIIDYEK